MHQAQGLALLAFVVTFMLSFRAGLRMAEFSVDNYAPPPARHRPVTRGESSYSSVVVAKTPSAGTDVPAAAHTQVLSERRFNAAPVNVVNEEPRAPEEPPEGLDKEPPQPQLEPVPSVSRPLPQPLEPVPSIPQQPPQPLEPVLSAPQQQPGSSAMNVGAVRNVNLPATLVPVALTPTGVVPQMVATPPVALPQSVGMATPTVVVPGSMHSVTPIAFSNQARPALKTKLAAVQPKAMVVPAQTFILPPIIKPTFPDNFPPVLNQTVSVVIAAYPPDFKLLKIVLLNLKWQTVSPFEVVVGVSQCSEDLARRMESAALKLNLPFKVHFIPEEKPCNAGKNRNRALDHATGNYIMVVDGDDLVHDKKIEVGLEMFKKFADLKLICHNYQLHPGAVPMDTAHWAPLLSKKPIIVGGSHVRLKPKSTNILAAPSLHAKEGMPVHHGHVMFRRDVFTRVKYHEEKTFNRGQDGKFVQETLTTFGGVYYIDLKLVGYGPTWPLSVDPVWDAFSNPSILFRKEKLPQIPKILASLPSGQNGQQHVRSATPTVVVQTNRMANGTLIPAVVLQPASVEVRPAAAGIEPPQLDRGPPPRLLDRLHKADPALGP